MKERQIIEISSEHKVLRTVLFAAAFVIAIGSIAFGLISLTKKTPGWQEATAALDPELSTYSKNFHALVYMEGSSGEIRDNLSTFNKIYTDSLKRAYKLLDSENEYTGYFNLASLNKNLGNKVKLASDLYEVLEDSYKKGTLFLGPLYRASAVLENTDNYDGEYEDFRMAELEKALADSSNFTAEFYPDNYVLINVSDDFKALLSEYEFNSPIIDLGENNYFYKTVMVDKLLSDSGYPGCMFYSD